MSKRSRYVHPEVIDQDTPVGAVTSLRAVSSLVGPVLYAVRVGDTIKFGYTEAAYERLRKFPDFRSNVLALRPGTRADETALHRSLRPHIAHGREHYHPTPEVVEIVNEWRAALNLEPVAA